MQYPYAICIRQSDFYLKQNRGKGIKPRSRVKEKKDEEKECLLIEMSEEGSV